MFSKLLKTGMALAVSAVMLTATVFADNLNNGTDWEKGVVRVTGVGTYKSNAKKNLRRPQALRAATLDAQRKLAEAVEGVQVTSESSMRDLELEYDIVKTRVNATIKGMTEVSSRYLTDGTGEVTLEMPIFGASKSVAEAAFLPFKDEPKESFPQPTSVNVNVTTNVNTTVGGVVGGRYTGLVVDCSGMGLEAVMSPVIKNNNGQPIYGYKNLDIDKVIEYGMASYAYSANDSVSRSRAGNNPLVVKAQRVDGTIPGNPVVSVADADKILIANQSDMFLENCNVVFVK